MLSLRRLSVLPSSHRVLTVAKPCWPGRQEPSLTGYNVCRVVGNTGKFDRGLTHLLHSELHWLDVPQQVLHKLGVTVHGVSKARLPNTSWTAATPHRTLPVVSEFDLLAATILSYLDIVAARSAVGRFPSPVRWPGMRCSTTSETRRSLPTISWRRKVIMNINFGYLKINIYFRYQK